MSRLDQALTFPSLIVSFKRYLEAEAAKVSGISQENVQKWEKNDQVHGTYFLFQTHLSVQNLADKKQIFSSDLSFFTENQERLNNILFSLISKINH